MKTIYIAALCFICITYAEYIPPGPKYRCPKPALLLHPCTCETESDVGITAKCTNTNLASMSIALQNLATFKIPIEKLTIERCHIRRLFGSLLYKLQLRTLDIVDTPIEIIEEHTFLGVNQTLNELYVYNSSLIEFPKLALKILGNLTTLKLDKHAIPSIPADAFADSELSGKLLKLHISNGNVSTLPIEALQPLRKLKMLDLHGNQLKALKRNQFKGLRDTEVLDLSYNKLVKLEGSHIADLTKMGWCNVSHNQITELSRGAFARNSVMKWLNMAGNKIKKLDSNSFRGMRFLRRLFLSDNLITDVGRGTFTSINRIGTIDLARNFIKKIDYQMFYQLNFIELIDVSENNVTEIQKLAFKDLFLTTINLSRNAISSVESGAFENCANMTVLDLSFNNIATLPKRTFDETTYASDLNIAYNMLTELNQVPLHNMTGLRVLNVSHNSITNIPRHTFPKLYELHTIDLSHNNLSDIFNSVFQTLFSLRTLDLSHNNLQQIKPSTFGALPTLLEIDLSYNGMKQISRGALTRLASTRQLVLKGNELDTLFLLPISVSHLDLSDNKFSQLPEKLWPSMNSLLSLDMSGNQLGDSLGKGSFEGLLTLQRLNLNFNGMRSPPWAALSDLSSLQYLYLEGNNLTKLEKAAFGRLPVVFELNLANNQLFNISSRAFEGLLQLIVLNMSSNNISYIPTDAMQGLVSLRKLDLSFNHLERIDNKTHSLLEDCLSLEKIDLSHNKFSFISRKAFPNNPYVPYKLNDIDLSYNAMPVITYDLTFGTKKIEKLNLSHNAIADIRRSVIGNLTRLRSLDLSYNKLESIVSEFEMFRLPDNLSELYLSHNELKELPWEHIKNISKIDVLDISYNRFEQFGNNLTELVMNGSVVKFEGNPLRCDCFVRPLRRYLSKQIEVDQIYKNIICDGPPYLYNSTLIDLPEERLNCPQNINTTRYIESEPGEYDVTPDLRFREFEIKNGNMRVRWLILKNEDIADPYIIIQNVKNPVDVIFEETLSYFKRSIDITSDKLTVEAKDISKFNFSDYQICVLTTDSKTRVRNLYNEQCRVLPNSLSSGITNALGINTVIFVIVFISNIYLLL